MEKRIWIKSGVIEELDKREMAFMNMVYKNIVYYYTLLYQKKDSCRYELNLSQLMMLCNRDGKSVINAVRLLANTIPADENEKPKVYYDRVQSTKNASHRPYRIFLRNR